MLSEKTTKVINKCLKDLSLSTDHACVYLASLVLGSSPASLIAKQTGLPRSTTYGLLRDLAKIGLISEVKEETKIIFTPTPPERLIELVKQKQNELKLTADNLDVELPKLLDVFNSNQAHFPKVRFYQGEAGLKTVYYDSLTADEILYLCQGTDKNQQSRDQDPQYLKDYIEELLARKIKTRELLQDNPISREYQKDYNSQINQIVIIPKNPENKFDHVDKYIYQNKIAYVSHDNLIGVIIEDETLAQNERLQFEALWDYYKNS